MPRSLVILGCVLWLGCDLLDGIVADPPPDTEEQPVNRVNCGFRCSDLTGNIDGILPHDVHDCLPDSDLRAPAGARDKTEYMMYCSAKHSERAEQELNERLRARERITSGFRTPLHPRLTSLVVARVAQATPRSSRLAAAAHRRPRISEVISSRTLTTADFICRMTDAEGNIIGDAGVEWAQECQDVFGPNPRWRIALGPPSAVLVHFDGGTTSTSIEGKLWLGGRAGVPDAPIRVEFLTGWQIEDTQLDGFTLSEFRVANVLAPGWMLSSTTFVILPGDLQVGATGTVSGTWLGLPVTRRVSIPISNQNLVHGTIDLEAGTFSMFTSLNGDEGEMVIDLHGTIANYPAFARAQAPAVVECDGDLGATITLDGSSTDDGRGSLVGASWVRDWEGAREVVGRDLVTSVFQPLGSQRYRLQVLNNEGQGTHDDVVVEVRDTEPPTLSEFAFSGPICLWAPNHKYVVLRVNRDFHGVVTDACDPNPELAIIDAQSSQPDNDRGDGNTTDDVVVFSDRVCLRAERSGLDQDGRTYTVHVAARDAAGNIADPEVTIHVPHDQRPDQRCTWIEVVEVADDGDPECTPIPTAGASVDAPETMTCATTAPGGMMTLLLVLICLSWLRIRSRPNSP